MEELTELTGTSMRCNLPGAFYGVAGHLSSVRLAFSMMMTISVINVILSQNELGKRLTKCNVQELTIDGFFGYSDHVCVLICAPMCAYANVVANAYVGTYAYVNVCICVRMHTRMLKRDCIGAHASMCERACMRACLRECARVHDWRRVCVRVFVVIVGIQFIFVDCWWLFGLWCLAPVVLVRSAFSPSTLATHGLCKGAGGPVYLRFGYG